MEHVRRIPVFALGIGLAACWLVVSEVRGQGQAAPVVNSPTYGDYATADIRVITPGVVFVWCPTRRCIHEANRQEGGINVVGMGTIVEEMKKKTPPPDVIVLPFQLMTTLSLDGGVVPGTFMPLGRNRMGLAVEPARRSPISRPSEKLAAALKSAKAVMRSNPASRTMVALLIDDVLKRPEFAGVNAPASTKGEGGQALAAGEGDMAIQTISQILPYKEIELVGPLPAELGAVDRLGDCRVCPGTHRRRCARAHPVSVAAGVEQGVEAKGARAVRI